jgi:hypothetical protein
LIRSSHFHWQWRDVIQLERCKVTAGLSEANSIKLKGVKVLGAKGTDDELNAGEFSLRPMD